MLQQCAKKEIKVWRGKADVVMINNDDLVVGDLFAFESGDRIAADGVVVEAQDAKCTEADLTGEPDEFPKVKIDESNWEVAELSGVILAKSLCVNGSGKAICTSVGLNTAAGAISDNSSDR
jgi:Ca2+-transporting ATPase